MMKVYRRPFVILYSFSFIIFFLIPIFLISPMVYAESSPDWFKDGVKAFRAADYERALQAFERAQGAGLDSPVLYYNLGVSYFKLGRYPEARAMFGRLTSNPKMDELAYYNLGLIAMQQDNADAARELFRRSISVTNNTKLRALAVAALRRLGEKPRLGEKSRRKVVRKKKGWGGVVTGDIGNNSHLVSVVKNGKVIAERGDSYSEYFTSIGGYVYGVRDRGLRFSAWASVSDYRRESRLDFVQLHLGANFHRKIGLWKTRVGGGLDKKYLGGSDYQNVIGLKVRGQYPILRESRLKLQYWIRYIQSYDVSILVLDPDNEQLTGWRQKATAETKLRSGKRSLRLSYTRDWYNAAFIYHSPVRHILRVTPIFPLSRNLEMEFDIKFRYSAYADPYPQKNGSSKQRYDARYLAALKLEYALMKNLRLYGKTSYTINNSSLDIYSYRRSIYAMGVKWYY